FAPLILGHEAVVALLEAFDQTNEAASGIGLERARDVLAVKRHGRCAACAGDAGERAPAPGELRSRRQHLDVQGLSPGTTKRDHKRCQGNRKTYCCLGHRTLPIILATAPLLRRSLLRPPPAGEGMKAVLHILMGEGDRHQFKPPHPSEYAENLR